LSSRNQLFQRWAKVLVPFLSIQAAAQLFSVAAGLVVVRGLPIGAYAIYTLVNALQGTLGVLTDAGVSSLLVARAGPVHADRARLSELVASAQKVRRVLEALALVLLIPLLWFWLKEKELTATNIAMIGVLVAITLHFQISASLFSTVPVVLLEVGKAQEALLLGALSRVLLVYAIVKIVPEVIPALAANALATGAQAALSRHYAKKRVDLAARVNHSDVNAMRTLVATQIVSTLYYAFSSQLTIWVIGLKGTKPSIAAVGALGRLGSVVALGQTGIAMLVVPRMARYTQYTVFRRRYVQVVAITLALGFLLIIGSFLAPSLLLWCLGNNYSNLGSEVPLAIGSAVTYVFGATIFLLNTSRAWIERAWLSVPITILVQVLALFFIDVSEPRGAIIFGWLSVLPPLAVNTAIALAKFKGWRSSGGAAD
jgi:hypothetical protein